MLMDSNIIVGRGWVRYGRINKGGNRRKKDRLCALCVIEKGTRETKRR